MLVPDISEPLFRKREHPGLETLYYRCGAESLSQKLLRKLGLRDIRQALDATFIISEGTDRLHRTYALWLAPEMVLPSPLLTVLLDRLPDLKWVYSQVTGTDHLDLELFRKRGVMVSNAGRLHSRRVAEMALACMFAHAKRLPRHIALQRRRRWQSLPAQDLSRQTVAIVGTGNIGKNVATFCRATGMQVVGASRDPARFGKDTSPYHRLVRLPEELGGLLSEADHVVLALPLNDETNGLIGREELRSMKPDASLINVARGAIVDESQLCRALSDGTIGGAYIERPIRLPPSIGSELYRTRNLVFTHYSAANSPHSMKEAFEQFLAGLQRMRETGQPPDRVA